MNKLIKGAVALGLVLTVASCGSDKKTATTTAAGATTAASSDVPVTGGATAASIDLSGVSALGLDPVQSQALTVSLTQAATAGVTIEPACLGAVVKQMSDADAQLIIDAGPAGTPKLSPAGEALSPAAQACATVGSPATG